jgi:phosphoribosylaminoimidazolecarboxamide formyltransferase/IMP cyclohydrolase
VEQIDIGGPALIRAAAKNHQFVTIACEPAQYPEILTAVRERGCTTPELRRRLAGQAFAHTAAYDAVVARYFADLEARNQHSPHPQRLFIHGARQCELRYGENPHQTAALYAFPSAGPHTLVGATQLHGKELSYNNLLDLSSALSVVRTLAKPAAVVLKHNNPCGAAVDDCLAAAMEKAWSGDPVSAFGSVLGVNVTLDAPTAEFLAEPGRFVEAIVAPDYSDEALKILTTRPKWKANVRLLKVGQVDLGSRAQEIRQIDGGLLLQEADDQPDDERGWQVVTRTHPTEAQLTDLRFAWSVARHVKSNAIVLVRDQGLVGVGAGQMSRVDAVEIAIRKAAARANGAVLASDAFFPFEDSILQAAGAGIAAVIQPGGSRRDQEVVAACDQHGLPMIFTGTRHFRH